MGVGGGWSFNVCGVLSLEKNFRMMKKIGEKCNFKPYSFCISKRSLLRLCCRLLPVCPRREGVSWWGWIREGFRTEGAYKAADADKIGMGLAT